MDAPTILVTGALTGIGRATAVAAAEAGYNVALSGRHADRGEALAEELRGKGAKALFVPCDVRFEDQIEAMVAATVAEFGSLEAALNNAGTEGQTGPLIDQTPETYRAIFDTNTLGTLMCLKHELRQMIANKRGAIVNVSSTFGNLGGFNASVYTGSKHAVEGFTKSAALEAAPFGVRVNAVAPGVTQTGMLDRWAGDPAAKAQIAAKVPMGRIADPSETAAAILCLLSPATSFVTGQVLRIDGGETA